MHIHTKTTTKNSKISKRTKSNILTSCQNSFKEISSTSTKSLLQGKNLSRGEKNTCWEYSPKILSAKILIRTSRKRLGCSLKESTRTWLCTLKIRDRRRTSKSSLKFSNTGLNKARISTRSLRITSRSIRPFPKIMPTLSLRISSSTQGSNPFKF